MHEAFSEQGCSTTVLLYGALLHAACCNAMRCNALAATQRVFRHVAVIEAALLREEDADTLRAGQRIIQRILQSSLELDADYDFGLIAARIGVAEKVGGAICAALVETLRAKLKGVEYASTREYPRAGRERPFIWIGWSP